MQMGADLYIRSINDKFKAETDPKFYALCAERDAFPYGDKRREPVQERINACMDEMYSRPVSEVGYFRDSYNSSDLLWFLGLSWWEDIGKLQNKKTGDLTVATGIPKFLKMVERREPPLSIEDYAEKQGVKFEHD